MWLNSALGHLTALGWPCSPASFLISEMPIATVVSGLHKDMPSAFALG